jgi:hypothetical protein
MQEYVDLRRVIIGLRRPEMRPKLDDPRQNGHCSRVTV